MTVVYKETNVFDEALNRMRMIYDNHDDVIVDMSGGKDSTVLFNLALIVAKEKGRLPVKVFWLDQEAEWQATVDYMDWIFHLPEVKPFWYQVPFAFPNNLSTIHETLWIWDEEKKDLWIHPKSDIAIHESPIDVSNVSRDKAFYILINNLPDYCRDEDAETCAVLSGMRVDESLHRRTAIMFGDAKFMGETWCRKTLFGKCRTFYPIYDFAFEDIWTAIGRNHWKYNTAYDKMYQYGVSKNYMRISALIHETAWHSIEMLQEFEPATYNKFVARINGTSTFNHTFDQTDIIPKELPFMFKDWREYRDYLLEHIIRPEFWEHYRNEWKGQDSEDMCRTHVHELILNDTCGTVNRNKHSNVDVKKKVSDSKYYNKELEEFMKYKGANYGN